MSEVVTAHESPVIPAEVLGAFVLSAARLQPATMLNTEQYHTIPTDEDRGLPPVAAILDRDLVRFLCADKSFQPGQLPQIIDDVQASRLLAVKHRIGDYPSADTVVTSVSLLGGPGRTPRPLLSFLVGRYTDGRFADFQTEAYVPPHGPVERHWQPRPKLGQASYLRIDNLNGTKPLLSQNILYDPLRAVRGVTTLVDAVLREKQAAA